MLNVIEGGLYSDIGTCLKLAIAEDVKAKKRVYLIVPEQQTVLAESNMARLLPPDAPLYFEATNFTRLANTVFRTVGGLDLEYCNKTERALIMWRAITELAPTLDFTAGKKEVQPGVVDRLLAAIAEMESEGVDWDTVSETAASLPRAEARLGTKLSDLASVSAYYKRLIKEKYQDAADDIGIMTKKYLEKPEIFDSVKFYIDGFTSFTAAQYAFIATLARYEDVSVYLTIPKEDSEAFEYTEIRRTRRTLMRAADKACADKNITRLKSRSTPLKQCCSLLWKTQGTIDNECLQNSDTIRIIEAPTPYEECDFVATDILTRVKSGAKFSDFAIIAREEDKYVGILDKALDNANISSFISKPYDVQTAPAVKLIYSAYAILISGFRGDDIISYLKSAPIGISREEIDLTELYIDTWGLGGEDIRDRRAWTMSPDGYTMRKSKRERENLAVLNSVRDRALAPLLYFEELDRKAKTVREHANALMKFLERIKLSDSIDERTERLLSLKEVSAAEKNVLIWGVICDTLDTLVNALDETEADTATFFSQLKVAFANVSVGRIPALCDSVTVGSADTIRLDGKKHIYLIGVNRAQFPGSISDSAYLTDRDKALLGTLGIELGRSSEEMAAKELFYFSRAFSYATETVTLLYTERNAALTPTVRDGVIDRIIELCGTRVTKTREIGRLNLMHSPHAVMNYVSELQNDDAKSAKLALVENK